MEVNANENNGLNDEDCVGLVRIKEEPQEDDDGNSNTTLKFDNADSETQPASGISFEFNDSDMTFTNLCNNDAEMWKCLADTFTNEDLAEVGVDHGNDNSMLVSNAVVDLPEIPEIGGSTSTDIPMFIPISSSDIKQIQGSNIRTGSGGDSVFFKAQNQTPCLRLMLNTNGKMEQTSGGTSKQTQEQENSGQVQINSGGAQGTVVNEIRITSISGAETGGSEMLINRRKTRGPGRKGKNAKIAVAESFTAARKVVPERSVIDSAPNIVLHHTAANYLPPVQTNATYSVSGSHQLQDGGNVSLRAISMADFASLDKSTVLVRRHANGVEINKIPGSGANRATYCNGRMLQAGATTTDVNGAIFRANSGVAERGNLILSVQTGSNNQQLTDRQAGTKMEQLFTSRLSGAGTPRRSVVTPSYIQRNLSLYNQLTAPTSKKSADFENGKLTQDKWMQCPNPSSAHPNCSPTPRIPERGALDDTVSSNVHVIKPVESPSLHHACDSSLAGTENNVDYLRSGTSSPTIVHGNGGVYNGTTHPTNYNNGTTGPRFAAFQMNPNGHSHYSNPPIRFNGVLEHHQRIVHDLRTRLQLATLDNFELKVKMHYTAKTNKELMTRLRLAMHETEGLKYQNQQLQIQIDHPTFYSAMDAPPIMELRAEDIQSGELGQNRSSNVGSDSGLYDTSANGMNITIKQEPKDDEVEVPLTSGNGGNISEGSVQVTGNDKSQQEQTGTANDACARANSTIVNLKRELEQLSNFPVAPNKKQCTDETNTKSD